MKRKQENAEIQEKINLVGRGNEELTRAVKTWEKLYKFVEHKDAEKLALLAQQLEEHLSAFHRTVLKLEK